MDHGVTAWALSPSQYVQEAVKNVETHLMEQYDGRKLLRICGSELWPSGYITEMDESAELDAEDAAYYQSQIGV